MTIKIPYDCPRGLTTCRALSNIIADNDSSFFCCGENDGTGRLIPQDKYTVCFKGAHDDRISHYDKRDLTHHMAVIAQAVAVVERPHGDPEDWSVWKNV